MRYELQSVRDHDILYQQGVLDHATHDQVDEVRCGFRNPRLGAWTRLASNGYPERFVARADDWIGRWNLKVDKHTLTHARSHACAHTHVCIYICICIPGNNYTFMKRRVTDQCFPQPL